MLPLGLLLPLAPPVEPLLPLEPLPDPLPMPPEPVPMLPEPPAPLPEADPPAVAARYSSREIEPSRLVSTCSKVGMLDAPLRAPALAPPAELDDEAPGARVPGEPASLPALDPAASTLIGSATAAAVTTVARYFVLIMECLLCGRCDVMSMRSVNVAKQHAAKCKHHATR